jgi:predicted enzyme related to lactoylglutathione lyase
MGEVNEYPHGTFCWIDLGTPDVAGAKTFYAALLGWDVQDFPAQDGHTYTIFRLGGKDIAGLHEHAPEEGTGWSSYISVNDVDETTTKARGLGAMVVVDAFDIPGAARMSLIRDPAGAEVSLWQAKGHIGAGFVNEVGAWSWNELVTPDLDAAKTFYGDLFGWKAENVPAAVPRVALTLGNLLIGGAHVPTPQEAESPKWNVSFTVANADDSVAKATELGGTIVLPPLDLPVGRFSIVADPAGATFTLAAVPGGPARGVDGS